MGPLCHARPKDEQEDENEEKPQRAEDEEAGSGGVPCDRRVGAGLPDEGRGGDRSARQTHRERRPRENFGGAEEGQGDQEGDKGRKEDEGGYEALLSGGDPEILHPPVAPQQEDVPGHEGRRGQLDGQKENRPGRARLRERHEGVERREDDEWVQDVSEEAGYVEAGCMLVRAHED